MPGLSPFPILYLAQLPLSEALLSAAGVSGFAMDKKRAKQIIVEIIRASGGSLTNKTNLFKAFYHAHLNYAQQRPDLLSTWPIVRMPRGPAIDRFNVLLGELISEGVVDLGSVEKGPYDAMQFELTGVEMSGVEPLSAAAIEAIVMGAESVKGKTATQVSDESHRRAWDAAKDGKEMNIYLDLISPEKHANRIERIQSLADAYRKVCGN